MYFDYTFNGITFEMEYEDSSNGQLDPTWTDVDFYDKAGCGDIICIERDYNPVRKKLMGSIDLECFTTATQEKIRKSAYEWLLNQGDI